MARSRGLGTNHDQRRADIAAAVLDVVADSGLSVVSLTTVAARAGVSPGRVQYYFPTKEALLEGAFDYANTASAERISVRLGGAWESAPPRQVLAVVLTELIPYDAQSMNHMRVRQAFAGLALHHDNIAERMRDEYQKLHRHYIAELLRREQEAGNLPTTFEPKRIALTLVALAEGLAYYVLIGACSARTAERNVREAVDQLYS